MSTDNSIEMSDQQQQQRQDGVTSSLSPIIASTSLSSAAAATTISTAAPSTTYSSSLSRRAAAADHIDHDDTYDTDHHRLTVLGARQTSSFSSSSSSPHASSPKLSFGEQLSKYLTIMAAKKTAYSTSSSESNPAVTAYYKKQRKILQRMIEVNKLQESDKHIAIPRTTIDTSPGASSSCVDHDDEDEEEQGENATSEKESSSSAAASAVGGAKSTSRRKKATTNFGDDDDHEPVQKNEDNKNDDADENEEDDENDDLESLAATFSLILNCILLGLKIFAAVRSGSLTVMASLLDSVLDLLSGIILVGVEYMIANSAPEDYPTGKHHFESIGTLIFSCVMFVASAKLIENSAANLDDIDAVKLTIDVEVLAVMGTVIGSKFVAYLLCRNSSHTIVQALAADHRNDVVTNIFGIIGLFIALHVSRYADPSFALATTLFIMYVWATSAYTQAEALSGKSASSEILNELTMLARNSDDRIMAVDTVRAVSCGVNLYIAEVDIVLSPDMPLREAHDIGEKLQMFLEAHKVLNIARAYVHLDYETVHDPKRHQ